MDKWQSQQAFWGSFGLDAYDEQTYFTQKEMPAFPHITYQSFGGRMDQTATLSVSLWYRESSWARIKQKADEILKYMSEHEPIAIPIDHGFLWFKIPIYTPFAQPMGSDSNDEMVKRILLTVEAECLTNY